MRVSLVLMAEILELGTFGEITILTWVALNWGKTRRSLQWFWCAFWVGGTQLAGFVYRVPAETNDFLAVWGNSHKPCEQNSRQK